MIHERGGKLMAENDFPGGVLSILHDNFIEIWYGAFCPRSTWQRSSGCEERLTVFALGFAARRPKNGMQYDGQWNMDSL